MFQLAIQLLVQAPSLILCLYNSLLSIYKIVLGSGSLTSSSSRVCSSRAAPYLSFRGPRASISISSKHPHDTFKCHQRHCVCWECSQKARHKAPPITPPSVLSTHRSRSVSPARELSIRQIIRHDTLLDNIRRVTRQPEDLCRQSSCPEVDGRRRHCSVLLEPPREEVIRSPPAEEEGAEYQCRSKSMIQPS